MASVGAQGRESLEQQLAKLKQYEQNVQSYKPNLEDMEHLNQEVQEAMIFENRHTSYTMEVCLLVNSKCSIRLVFRHANDAQCLHWERPSRREWRVFEEQPIAPEPIDGP